MQKKFTQSLIHSKIFIDSKEVDLEFLKHRVQNLSAIIEQIPQTSMCFLQQNNPLDFSLAFFLLLDFGHCPMAVSPDIPVAQKEELKRKIKAHWLVQDRLFLSQESCQPDFQNAYVCLTSGTTATPKICYLSIQGAIKNAQAHAQSMGVTKDHLLLQNLPLYHSFGIICYLWTTLVTGCSIEFNKDLLTLKNLSSRDLSNVVLYSTQSQLAFMLKEKTSDFKGPAIMSFGAGPCLPQDVFKLKEKFDDTRFYVSYGLTEAGPRVTTGPVPSMMTYGYIGQALDGVKLKILDERGHLKNSGSGKLCIQSPSLKLNLDPQEVIDDYLITRDQVHINDSGHVQFLSREQDLIKVSGISVYPKDIEYVVKQLPDVLDCFVISANHKLYGEIPYLIVESSLSSFDILNQIKDQLNVYQMPKKIDVLPHFQRTSLNKIDRQEILKKLQENS